jgi:hypothetical protein
MVYGPVPPFRGPWVGNRCFTRFDMINKYTEVPKTDRREENMYVKINSYHVQTLHLLFITETS